MTTRSDTESIVARLAELLGPDNQKVHSNLSVPQLTEAAVRRGEGALTNDGALTVSTGQYTGRSPKDKFLVDVVETHTKVDWGKVNQPITREAFDGLLARCMRVAAIDDLYVIDGAAAADPAYRIPVRVGSQYAWHALFARQLFLRPSAADLARSDQRFTILVTPGVEADPDKDHVRSEVAVALDLDRRIALITGTQYAGEIKKSIFTVLNYLLPDHGVFPMHCAANVGSDGKSALFFGLSGTGKTTLSADPERQLIGDDEHGWSDNGVFNLEGGCYAKCSNLKKASEPQIWEAIRFGTVLENVVIDPSTGIPDYADVSLTENTRAAYPVDFIPGCVESGMGGHPKAVFFLTADASGVLPPIARLSESQALFHFLSGYTSKLAGTERGVTTPEPNFSPCFAGPFLPRPATLYAKLLGDCLRKHTVPCYLVNTGWIGGPYGVGQRISLDYTRRIIQAALSGELAHTVTYTDPFFGLECPVELNGIPDYVLKPRASWGDMNDYDDAAKTLALKFWENIARFGDVSEEILTGGPEYIPIP